MPLPVFEKKDEIPKGFEDLYEEKDGKWQPKAAAAPVVDDAAELKKTLQKVRDELKEAQTKATTLEREKTERETNEKGKKAGLTDEQLKQIRGEVRTELEKEYAPKLQLADTHAKENRSLKLDNQVKALYAKSGARSERLEALWKLSGEDYDLTDDGKPMVKATPGVSLESHINDTVKKNYPEFFEGTKADGGGAAGAQAGRDPKQGTLSVDAILANPTAALQTAHAATK